MKSTRAALFILCTAILVACAIDTANTAIVPFNGTEYSWLHLNIKNEPTGDWKSQIDDNIAVRVGDAMQFQNRWYNSLPGTADPRISYGGGQPYVCSGADEVIFYGLNYGNYYPGGSDSMSLYSTVSNCSDEPNNLVINHQYVYNGIVYGSCVETDKWTAKFHQASPEELAAFAAMPAEQQNESAPTLTPPEKPAATPATELVVTDRPAPSPTPGYSMLAALSCALAAILLISSRKKREN